MKVTPEMVVDVCARTGLAPRTVRDVLYAALAPLPEPAADMLGSLRAWWEQHALALRMTSRSVHQAIGVALSALEQGKPFPTMRVLMDPSMEHAERELYLDDLKAAEAKLEKVRAWLKDEVIEASAYDRLHAILYGEP